MEKYGLNNGKSNEGVPYSCYSCLKGDPEKGGTHRIHCDRGTLMNPNEYCSHFDIDDSKTPEEVIDFVKNFIKKSTNI